MESTMQKLGKWSWIVGICLAVVLGIITDAAASPVVTAVLVILGVLVGIINVTQEESKAFFLAAIALLLAANFGAAAFSNVLFSGKLDVIMTALQLFVAPMTVVVAVKAIYAVAKDQ